jgi:ribosomal protein S12 methylthiotransferase accessory factor
MTLDGHRIRRWSGRPMPPAEKWHRPTRIPWGSGGYGQAVHVLARENVGPARGVYQASNIEAPKNMSLKQMDPAVAGRLHDLVSPLGGLIRRVIPLPPAPGEPAYSVCAAELGDLSQVLPSVAAATGGRSTRGQVDGAGGGIETARATTIAIAEALERYSSCVYSEEQFLWETADTLGDAALDLDTVPRCSTAELAHPQCPVRAPDHRSPIRWVLGVSLHSGRLRWVPAMLTYLHIAPMSPAERFALPISTGCAAHPDPVTAVLNAVNEVIERDAISLTWLQRLELPRLELDACSSELRDFLDVAAGRDVHPHLFDATTDVGVPTVYCVAVADHHPTCRTIVTCATDVDPQRAVTKVLREAASGRIALQAPHADPPGLDDFASVYDGAAYMGRPERASAFDFLLHSAGRRQLSDMPRLQRSTPAEQLAVVLRRLEAAGAEAFVVDLTTDEALRAGVTVVRVLIPALQPLSFAYRARFLGHPRLYEAPVRMGFAVLPEPDLNPWPQPFA